MRTAFIAVLSILVSVGTAAQDSSSKADGKMWQNYGNSSPQGMFIKAAYVQGAIEGLRAGTARGYIRGRIDEKQQNTDAAKATDFKSITTGMDKVQSEVSPQHASVLDIVHQMDKFYSDYKNTPVCMIVAVQESIQSVNGTPLTEQDLELMRQQGCNR